MYQLINNLKKIKIISLFSGYGAQEIALNRLNILNRTIGNSDIDNKANTIYDLLNYPIEGNYGDIKGIDECNFPKCNFLTYSFPCVDISIAGQQKGIEKGTRSGLLYEVERILSKNQPKYLMLENVQNLVSKKHMPKFEKHINFLNELGYGCGWQELNAADFGSPQNRVRVIMIAVLNKTNEEVDAIMKGVNNHKKERVTMRNFIEEKVDESYYIDGKYSLVNSKKNNTICHQIARLDGVKYDQASRIYSIDGCSPCLTKTLAPKIMTDDGRVRKISVREGYRFMGLTENEINRVMFSPLSNQSHLELCGNSICINVLEAVYRELFSDFVREPRVVKNWFWNDLKKIA
jgi:DNA-cytosine methyltransferase